MRKVYERPTLEMVTIKMKDVLLQSGPIPQTDDDELPIRIQAQNDREGLFYGDNLY